MKGELISQELRGKVTVKIQDMLPHAKETEKFARAIENQIYERSRTKEEYFDLVASNICYRDISQDWQSHTFRQNVVDKL
ncbi:uncharacterized protein LOC115631912 isoform X2 [Scaptodrosophila lebanonensis]|nr:uncharacterized protein LOC115631912 isoform X2 [Scaptodrosophila lebanonensis]